MTNSIKTLTFILISLFFMGEGIAQNQSFYNVTAGNGNGLRFWSGSNSYKISFGNSSEYKFGPVADYSIKNSMSGHAARGWTWGVAGATPIAALNTTGNFAVKGTLETKGDKLLFGNTSYLQAQWAHTLTWRSTHNTATRVRMLDKQGTLYGSIYGSHDGKYFGLLDGDGNWAYLSTRDEYTQLRVNNAPIITGYANGKVRIGNVSNSSNDYKLFVEKGILTEIVKVAVKNTSDWSDYVFNEDYHLMPLSDLGSYLKNEKHLPNVPSAEEMVENGLDVAKMDAKLLEKIEEAHLYILELHEQMETMNNQAKEQMEKMNAQITALQKQVDTKK